MKIIHVAFACLLAIAGITLFILLSEPPAGVTGVAHETIAGMKLGGDGAARLEPIGRAPFYFQIGVICFAASLLYMGIAEHRRDTQLKVSVAVMTAIALFVWYMLYSGYEAYLATGESDVVFGFPVPTNWMFWGIWGSFAIFDLFYVLMFRRYFLPYEDEKAFDALVAELKADEERA